MKVYFIRHGQSDLTEVRHQFPQSSLIEKGRKEAAAIAHRFSNIPTDVIITSSYTRAFQTAQAIEKVKSVPLIQTDLFIERRMPSSFLGKVREDPEVVTINHMLREHFYDPDFHYADEENFTDLIIRAKQAFDFVLLQQKENVVVVTHGYFLIVLLYYMFFGNSVEQKIFDAFRKQLVNTTSGLTICEYIDETWKLLTWNDCAHLGE